MSITLSLFAAQGLNALMYGMLLFLVSSGLTLIYSMMGFLNLSHVFFFMLGAYYGSTFLELTHNFWLSLLLAPVALGFTGVLAERFFLKNRGGESLGYIGEILPTLGVALLILTVVDIFWDMGRPAVEIPESLQGLVPIAGFEYPVYRLFIIAMSFIILCILTLILYKTRIGKIVRASVSDAEMVSALGVNTTLVFTLVFGTGIWMAGIAGVAAAPVFPVTAAFAYEWSLEAFVVVIVGGLGSLPGAFTTSLVIGALHSFGVQFIPRLVPVLIFLFMVLVLAFKPRGLFGSRE